MVLNYVLPTTIVLEAMMIAIQAYAFSYNKNHFHARIDEIYLGASSTYFVINFAWILHFKRDQQQYNLWSRLVRGIQGFLLIALGSLMVQSAKLIEVSNNCASFEIVYTEECQKYEAKMIAGILSLIVSIFYLLPPVKPLVFSTSHIEILPNYISNRKDHNREKFRNMFFPESPTSHQPNENFGLPTKTKPESSRPESLEILNPNSLYQYQAQQDQQLHTPRNSVISIDGTHNMIPRAQHKHVHRVHFNSPTCH